MGLTYDAGALIAAEKNDRKFWLLHKTALKAKIQPTVPAGVLAEAWRKNVHARIAGVVKGCTVEALDDTQAKAVGRLIGASGLHDTVDVAVVEGTLRRGDAVVTSNRRHMEQVAQAINRAVHVYDV